MKSRWLVATLAASVALLALTVSNGPPRLAADQPVRNLPASHGTLVSTADMRTARAVHTATALADGRVLVAGGFVTAGSPNGAEAFDPETKRFAPLPPMLTTRHSHTATRLPDGRVLIAGGFGAGSTVLTAAEIFDPVTNRFTPTGSLGAARSGHVAVLLTTGKVLLVGGVGPAWSFLANAELYDPATGLFSPTGGMAVPRESHVAVRLQEGTVLVVGGHRGRRQDITIHASAEIYDPASGVFRSAGSMGVRRHKHDAVLLADGRVLITGGTDERDAAGIYNSTELFDPTMGSFSPGAPLQRGRYKHAGSSVLLSNGLVLVAGGAPQAETYDPQSGRFTVVNSTARMAGQFSAAAPLKTGGVLITGGYGGDIRTTASAWLYLP